MLIIDGEQSEWVEGGFTLGGTCHTRKLFDGTINVRMWRNVPASPVRHFLLDLVHPAFYFIPMTCLFFLI